MTEERVRRLEAQVLRLESYINILRRELSTQGNLIVGDTPHPDGLTVGANDTILVADSAEALGLKWQALASFPALTEAAQDAVGTILLDTTTIDFTYDDATPTISAIVIDDSITFAKMQNITTDRLLGRDTAGTGNAEELTVGGGVEFTGSAGIQRSALTGDVTASAGSNATTIANDAVTDAKLRNSQPLSVIGRGANTTGDPGDLTAPAGSDHVLRESGSILSFGEITTGGIEDLSITTGKLNDNAVDNTKLANMTEATVKGRAAGAGTGDPTDLSATQVVAVLETITPYVPRDYCKTVSVQSFTVATNEAMVLPSFEVGDDDYSVTLSDGASITIVG